jgi:biopolymer transport protein ExbD
MRLESTTAPRTRAPGMTSLVDVVFILLFFFMLAARPAPPQALALTVGDAATPGATTQLPRLRLQVLGRGRVELGGRVIALAELGPALRAASSEQVQLTAGPAAQLQDLVDALERLRAVRIGVDLLAPSP